MAKTKNQIVENKKNNTYLSNALCIAIAIFCVLLIGRVGSAGTKIFLFVNFLFLHIHLHYDIIGIVRLLPRIFK